MNNAMNKKLFLPLFLGLGIFVIDRITKFWALGLSSELVINRWLSFALVFNRGINWGLFNNGSVFSFVVLTIFIILIIAFLMRITVKIYHEGKPIVGYLLVLVGSISNCADRLLYGGVIDFIVVWFGSWSWPAFNIADAAILLGLGLLVWDYLPKFSDPSTSSG